MLGFFASFPGIAGDLVSFSVAKEHQESLFDLLQILVSASPTSTLLFLCHGQSQERQIIIGAVPFRCFLQMLINGGTRTNICYVVTGEAADENDLSSGKPCKPSQA